VTNYLNTFAATESKGDILSALGINWQMLILQGIAFLVLVWLLSKFVFPVLIKAVDDRQAAIEAGSKAAQEASEKAEKAEQDVAKLLNEARREAKDIVATAKDEAIAAVEAADGKASARAKKIVESAHEQIEKDVIAAKKALHNETIELVARATERVLGDTLTDKVDEKLVTRAVKESN
jgi:F-type H+-transporting ATPase subunit b